MSKVKMNEFIEAEECLRVANADNINIVFDFKITEPKQLKFFAE